MDDILEVEAYNYAWGLGADKTSSQLSTYKGHKNSIIDYINTSNNRKRIDFLRAILSELNY